MIQSGFHGSCHVSASFNVAHLGARRTPAEKATQLASSAAASNALEAALTHQAVDPWLVTKLPPTIKFGWGRH